MTDDAFLQAIIAEPDDDTHRLVYADWLQDQGQGDRGEFIRTQVELDRLPADDPGRAALAAREAALQRTHWHEWRSIRVGDASGSLDRGHVTFSFRRGFIEDVTVKKEEGAYQFLEHAEPLFRSFPLRRLRLDAGLFALATVERLARLPQLARIEELALTSCATVIEVAAALLTSPTLRPGSLCVERCSSGTPAYLDEMEELAAAPALSRLRSLALRHLNLGAAAARVLAAWPGLAGLSELDLSGNVLGAIGAAALLASPHLGGLKSLSLAGSIGTEGYGNSWWPRPNIGDDGVEVVAASPRVARLTRLKLQCNGLTPRAVTALIDSPHLEHVHELGIAEPTGHGAGDVAGHSQMLPAGMEEQLRARFGRRLRVELP
jgi:uncharacterized protein (TIGR02996 family)